MPALTTEERLSALERAVFGPGEYRHRRERDVVAAFQIKFELPSLKAELLRCLFLERLASNTALIGIVDQYSLTEQANPLYTLRAEISRLRSVLSVHGVFIEAVRGTGWFINEPGKRRLMRAAGLKREAQSK